jgi:hypothetical protein
MQSIFCHAPGRGGKEDSSRGELSALLLTAVRYLGGSVDTVLVEELATMSELCPRIKILSSCSQHGFVNGILYIKHLTAGWIS